jgi:hypothetical protein
MNISSHEQNALEYLQTMPSEILSQFIKGEVDLSKLAKVELSYRGQNANGDWVGFKEAAKVHQVVI